MNQQQKKILEIVDTAISSLIDVSTEMQRINGNNNSPQDNRRISTQLAVYYDLLKKHPCPNCDGAGIISDQDEGKADYYTTCTVCKGCRIDVNYLSGEKENNYERRN